MKECTHCKEEKEVENYYRRPDTGGLKSRCKTCECLYSRARNYKISLSEAQRLMDTPNCDCCGKELIDKRHTYIDHDHKTNKIRGILCMSCNSGIGFLGDNEMGVIKALQYLLKDNKEVEVTVTNLNLKQEKWHQ